MLKRMLCLLLVMMLCLGCGILAQAEEEIIYSVGFEDADSAMFTVSGNASLSVSTEVAHDGKNSLKVSNRKENDWDAADLKASYTPINAGEAFTLTAWVYVDAEESGDFTIGKASGDYAYLKTEKLEGRTWTELHYEGVLDDVVNLRFMTTSDGYRGKSYYLDDITVTGVKPDEKVAEATATFEKYASDFSAGTDGWYARSAGGAQVTVTEEGLLITGRTATWNSPGRDFSLESGVSYDLSVWVKQDEKDKIPFILSVARTKNGTESYANLATADAKMGEWTQLKCTYKAGNYDSFVLYVETSSGNVSFTIRDFTLEADITVYRTDIPSLKAVYADYFDFGSAVVQSEAENNELMAFYTSQFSIVTCGNELKPDYVIDVAASKKLAAEDDTAVAVHFDSAKPLLDYAQENGLKVHGHVLVWHSQTPEAFFHEGYNTKNPYVSREVMLARLDNYIRQVMEYMQQNYPGVIVSWDVVNEAVADGSSELRDSNWTRVVGDDFIIRAFEIARKYAPEGTLLFYNDYNSCNEPKLTGIAKVVASLMKEGLIDGYGFQSHFAAGNPTAKQVKHAFDRLLGLGELKLRISELDVQIRYDLPTEYEKQATYYGQLMELYKEYAESIISVQVWGITDDQSWKADKYPLLFDKHAAPKQAFWAVVGEDAQSE